MIVIVFMFTGCFNQKDDQGNLSGVIKESGGNVLKDVKVEIGGKATLTDGLGKYVINDLKFQKYSLIAKKEGYKQITKDIQISEKENIINLELKKLVAPKMDIKETITDKTINLTINATDSDGEIKEVTIDWGDNTTSLTITSGFDNIIKEHIYSSEGTFTIKVTAKNDDGAISSEALNVKVPNIVPKINITSEIEGLKLTLTGTVKDSDGEVKEVTIDWGDNTTSLAITSGFDNIIKEHIYSSEGTFTIKVTAKNDDGAISSEALNVKVPNIVPKINITSEIEGLKLTLTGTVKDSDGEVKEVTIDWGDNTTSLAITSGFDNIIKEHIYSSEGTFTIKVTAKDDDGAISSEALNVKVPNIVPKINITSEIEGLKLTLTGTVKDSDGEVKEVTIDWGDNTTSLAITSGFDNIIKEHIYSSEGTFTIKVTAKDDDGAISSEALNVKVPNIVPKINITSEIEGLKLALTGTVKDSDGEVKEVTIDWGDNTTSLTITSGFDNIIKEHLYSSEGTFTIKVTAKDDDGAISSEALNVKVPNIVPKINITSEIEGLKLTLTGTVKDSDGEVKEVTIDWGDNTTSLTITSGFDNIIKEHLYSSEGTFTIKVTAKDDDGAISSEALNVKVPNIVPKINITSEIEGLKLTLTGTVKDSDGEVKEVTIDWGDNTTSLTITSGFDNIIKEHIYSSEGTFTIKVTAKNDDGAISSEALNVKAPSKLKWSYKTGDWVSSPAIGSDGTIYVGSSDNKLYAINPDGTLKWSYLTGYWVTSSPAIGSNGIIYVGSWDHRLYAINPDGTLKWSYLTGYRISSSPTIGSDGTIYVGSRDSNLYAINPDGTLKWSYLTGNSINSNPAIGSDGTIYVGSHDNKLYAINPDGTLKWSYLTGDWINSSPVIGSNGTIYAGSCDHKLYAINPDGTLKWSYEIENSIDSSPVIGSDGTIYVGSYDRNLYAINPDGTLKWNYEIGYIIYSKPAIGNNDTIYVGSYKLYAINLRSK
ncbi:beta-alanine-activating enzyme beta-propeller domain-containing protein [Haliovirga abyssi]|nr:PQQ-binding-like beta-propeller repeat protein [Haliovirga abyssi]